MKKSKKVKEEQPSKTTEKSIIELIHKTMRTSKFTPITKESSGLPDDLTDEEIRELIENINRYGNPKEKKKKP